MPSIRPSSDLRNNYNEISTFCHTYQEPVFITKNGAEDLVVMSNAEYERLCGKEELTRLLKEALEAKGTGKTTPAEKVFVEMGKRLRIGKGSHT